MTTATKTNRKVIPRILPFVPNRDPKVNNGLAKYGFAIHEGAEHTERLACLEKNGIRRWVTGLNEFSSDVQNLPEKEKNAAIAEIRRNVAFLEQSLVANVIDPDDKDFWAKVKICRPENDEFWSTKELVVSNEPVFLDPTDPEKLLLLCAIRAGGFSSVSPSYDTAMASAKPPKFYLDLGEDTTVSHNELKRIKNKAKASLQELSEKDPGKLFCIVKCVDKSSVKYTKNTSQEVIYAYLDDYIEGLGAETAKRASINFNSLAAQKHADLRIRAITADAALQQFIVTKADGCIYHSKTNAKLGRTIEDVWAYLGNPTNADVCDAISKEVESTWKN